MRKADDGEENRKILEKRNEDKLIGITKIRWKIIAD